MVFFGQIGARSASLPCVRGGGQNLLILAGGVVKKDNPPVKNQRFLTAPFTQGGLWARTELPDKLKFEKLYSFSERVLSLASTAEGMVSWRGGRVAAESCCSKICTARSASSSTDWRTVVSRGSI